MHPLSDKDLDRLSREAAEQYDVDQNTSGWEQLEQKLNKHLPEKGRKEWRRFLFFIWLFALLSGGGLLWMLTGNHSPQLITLKQGSAEISQTPSENKTTDQTLIESNTKKDDNSGRPETETTDHPLYVPDHETIDGNKENASFPKQSTVQKNLNPRIQKPVLDKKNFPPANEDVRGNNGRLASSNERSNFKEPVAIKLSPIPVPADQSDKDKQDNRNAIASGDTKLAKDSLPVQNQPIPTVSQSIGDSSKQLAAEQMKTEADTSSNRKKITAQKNKSGFNKGFQIGVIAAPDMSNVKFTNTDKVGFNVGIQIGYRISPRWSVNTGAIYTRKNYTSQGKDFNPPKGSWLDNVKLDRVEGHCFMFDIPLNVRYDLNTSNSHRYFLSTGLSTYLMKKEDYHYHYQYPNGNPGYRYRSYPSSEHHWLSILNISAGFEKKLSNRLSLQAEPYLKIPLGGVGYGNINLNSYGVYFTLKFSHTNKR